MKRIKSFFLLLIICLNLALSPSLQNEITTFRAENDLIITESVFMH